MAIRPQQYRLKFPLTAAQVEGIDSMFETLFRAVKGVSTAVGARGPQGFTGIPGSDGEDGADGFIPGSPGIRGIQGIAGPAGVDGEDGADADTIGWFSAGTGVTLSGVLQAAAGTVASPSVNWGDVGTGVYRSGTDKLSFTANGTDSLIINANGSINVNQGISSNNGNLQAAAGGSIGFANRSFFTSASDGVLRMINTAASDFNRLQFGGVTSAFPSWQRSSAAFIARLADDSADTSITASALTLSVTALTAPNGGTGFASYAVGDLLSASTTTALSKVAAVASGSILASAGVSTLPTWSSGPSITSLTTSSFVAAGATPAASGALRMGNSVYLKARNVANSADIQMFTVAGDNNIYMGQSGINLIPNSVNLQDLGDSTNLFRTGYFGTSFVSPIVRGGTSTTQTLVLQTTNGVGAAGADIIFKVGNNGGTEAARILNSGNTGIGVSPTAVLHLKAGTTAANSAPLKLNTGTVMTTAEAGAIEFTTDDFFATITTSAARKAFILDNGSRLTSGKIPIATTNGRLIDGQTPLTGTKIYWVSDTNGGAVNRKLTFIDGILTAEV